MGEIELQLRFCAASGETRLAIRAIGKRDLIGLEFEVASDQQAQHDMAENELASMASKAEACSPQFFPRGKNARQTLNIDCALVGGSVPDVHFPFAGKGKERFDRKIESFHLQLEIPAAH